MKLARTLLFLFCILIFSTLISCKKENKENEKNAKNTVPVAEVKKINFPEGTYEIGRELKKGIYKVKLLNPARMGYVVRLKGNSSDNNNIIANGIFSTDSFIEIKETDKALKIQGVDLEEVNLNNYKPEIKKKLSNGLYLVNHDILPGTYSAKIIDKKNNFGYFERRKSVSMENRDIIKKSILEKDGLIQIHKDDFAIQIDGLEITYESDKIDESLDKIPEDEPLKDNEQNIISLN